MDERRLRRLRIIEVAQTYRLGVGHILTMETSLTHIRYR
jgi:hypothetical protein